MAAATAESLALLEQQAPVEDRDEATRALMGAVILGVLDHVGANDLKRWRVDSVEDITLGRIGTVLNRGDSGLHGCGFEYAVHAALNRDSRIPDTVRGIVTTAVSGEVGVLFEQLGVPFVGWSRPLRAVMVGTERRWREHPNRTRQQMEPTDYTEFDIRVAEELGHGALIWGTRRGGPHAVWRLLPDLRCSPFKMNDHPKIHLARRRGSHRLPPDLSRLWQADLLIGGADVERTKAVEGALRSVDPPYIGEATAWVAATVKYPRGKAEPGPGIHLAIETAHGGSGNPVRSERVELTNKDGLRGVRLPLDGDFVHAFNRAYYLLRTWTVLRTRQAHPREMPDYSNRLLYAFLSHNRSQKAQDLGEELLRRVDEPMCAAEFAARLAETTPSGLVSIVNEFAPTGRSVLSTTLAPVPEAVAA